MDTKAFGKPLWNAMFFVAAGYDLNKTPKNIKDQQYINFFKSIGDVLPCIYCRQSYKDFFRELDITKYLDEENGLMKFNYDLKNKVSNKLINQENKEAIKCYKKIPFESLSDDEKAKYLRKISKIYYTKDQPPFSEVVQEYMKHKAKCSSKTKTCTKDEKSIDGGKKSRRRSKKKYTRRR